MAITTQDGLIAALAAGETFVFPPLNLVNNSLWNTTTSWALHSSWTASSRTGYTPTSLRAPETCSSSTTGAAPLPALTAGNQYYLGTASYIGGGIYQVAAIFDRLAHVRVDPSITTAQTVNMTLPARADARGTAIFAEIVANTTGATSMTTMPGAVSVSYTNELGQSGRIATGFDHGNSATQRGAGAGGLTPLMMAADQGVTSVETVTFTTAPGSSFTLLIVLARVVWATTVMANGASNAGFFDGGGTNLGTSPCLFAGHSLSSALNPFGPPGTISARIIQG